MERVASPLPCLSLLWPTTAEEDLLRACLWSGTAAHRAWQRWQQSVGDPMRAIQADVSGIKSLLPLLHRGLQSGGDIDPTVRASIAAAAVAETVRWRAYAAVCARAFGALSNASVPYLVLKGPALAVSVYPDTALRHSHDVDVLVRTPDLERAAAALSAARFVPPPLRQLPVADGLARTDQSGLMIELHTRLYRLRYYKSPFADLWERSRSCEIAGLRVRTLSTADHLLYVCGQASCCASRDSLKWVADAWYLLEKGRDLDWEALLRAARASRLVVPLAVMLRALAVQLQAPVPLAVLDSLDAEARTADRGARDVAIAGVRAGKRGSLRNLFRATPSWHGRLDLLRWMLLPSPTALRQGEPLRYPRAWPVYYLIRPLAYIARRLASRRTTLRTTDGKEKPLLPGVVANPRP